MRVGLLIVGDMEAISGGYLYNRKLCDYLQRMGDEVVVISLPQQAYWRQLAENFVDACLQRIAAANLDILIEDAMAHPALFLLNRRISTPVVTLVHLLASFERHAWHSGWLYRIVERCYLNSVSGIIANSQTTLAQARQVLRGRLPPYCVAVPAGDNFPDVAMDVDYIRRRALKPGPLNILLVGNVIHRKGVHVLIQALMQLPAQDFRLTVAGRLDMEPGYVAYIENLIRASGLQERISLNGAVQGQLLADLYGQHDLMVLPSAYESFGIVYVEAQQFGLPVIGTTAGAAKEIIRQGENGYLLEPADADDLAERLRTLQQDRQLLQAMSENALAAYPAYAGWDDSCGVIRQYLLHGGWRKGEMA